MSQFQSAKVSPLFVMKSGLFNRLTYVTIDSQSLHFSTQSKHSPTPVKRPLNKGQR